MPIPHLFFENTTKTSFARFVLSEWKLLFHAMCFQATVTPHFVTLLFTYLPPVSLSG
eukprot:NODE_2174_length_387_cov_151.950000_g2164_i0.p1 GENE.NODE_2174_length_387_cov_151.950000_g2164_i0~~NODE_2174_length_387_cov_151.950000_g2164_i0.p1  ORF type:complete len:57 (+),score=4.86 NODE_2174_length_387_cov_151.950000_g2164_i0:63-233(+)